MILNNCPKCGSANLREESTGAAEIDGVAYQFGWIECNDCGLESEGIELNDGPSPVGYDAVRAAWNTIVSADNAR